MSKPQSYWEKRKARELYEELVKAEDTAEEMRQLYIASSNEIKEEAVKLARRFQLRHNLSVKEAERLLARSLDPDDIKNLIMMLKQDPQNAELAAELESQAYASRISRLMAVQSSIDTVANEIYRRSNAATTAVLQDIGQSMYYKQIFEMQQRAGAAFGFTPLDPDRLMDIINRRWSGQNFSERLWANREQLAAEVKKQLLLGILTGRANRKMAQEIDGRFSVSYNNTRRLVRTEANYVANQLQVESYKDTSVDRYIYVAILDLRTSEVCRDLDKKRFLVSNAIVGENYPPMHPWCRSTTIAWMPDQLLKKLQQSAIDPATGEPVTVPGDMTYREWYDKYVKDNPEAVVQEKSYKNRATDTKQYESYKAVLGDRLPDNVYDFQKTKYNNPTLFRGWQLDARRQRRLQENPDLRLPKVEDAVIADQKFTKYFFDPASEDGWPKGEAFMSRLGYNDSNWRLMQQEIRQQAAVTPARPTVVSEHGQKYNQEMVLYGIKGTPMSVMVAWIDSKKTGKMMMTTAMPGKVKI